MTEEAAELRQEMKRRRHRELLILVLFLGLMLALMVLGYLLFRETETNRQAIDSVQKTLNTTCDAAEKNDVQLAAQDAENCKRAENNELPEVIQGVDDPDPNDPESQEAEIQDPELQEPESQDPERQDEELNDPDPNDPETQDPELADAELEEEEIQESEVQETEEQEAEVQDPEEPNTCPPGYTEHERTYDPTPVFPDSGDEEVWLVCLKD